MSDGSIRPATADPTLEDLGLTRLRLRRSNILANLGGEQLRTLADREKDLKPLLDADRWGDYVRALDEVYGLPAGDDDEYAEEAASLAIGVGRERELLKLDPLAQVAARGCDAEDPPIYLDGQGGYICRCMVCGRCGHHTGNNTQGHYWRFCGVTKSLREFHMCCPNDCELEAVRADGSAEDAH